MIRATWTETPTDDAGGARRGRYRAPRPGRAVPAHTGGIVASSLLLLPLAR